MDTGPPRTKRVPTTNITGARWENEKITPSKSHRKIKKDQIPKQTILGPKERLLRRETNHRPLQIEQMHQTTKIQNVNNESSPAATAQRMLDSSAGLERRVLARASHPKKKTLPRFPLPRTKLAIQSPSIWPKHWTTNIYKTDGSCRQSISSKRHLVPAVSGRFVNNKQLKRREHSTLSNCHLSNRVLRMDHKPKQIPHTARTNIPMARSSLRPTKTHGPNSRRENGRVKNTNFSTGPLKKMHKKENNETTRVGQLDWSIQSFHSAANFKNKNIAKILQQTAPRFANKAHKRHEIKPSQMVFRFGDTPSIRRPISVNHHPNGCIIKRLRFPNRSRSFPRKVRSIYDLSNKHIGTPDSLVCSANGSREKRVHSDPLRQCLSSISSQKRHISGVSPFNDFRTDMEKSSYSKLDNIHLTHTGQIQRPGRPTLKGNNNINRMVSSPKSIPESHSQEKSETTGGLVCHQPKSPVKDIHFSMSGPKGSGSGRNVNELVEVGTPICFSPDQFDFEGFSETGRNSLRVCNLNYTGPSQTMVHEPTNQGSPLGDSRSSPTTSSERQTNDSTNAFQASRVDLIKSAYIKQFPNCPRAVDLMATPLRKSSVKDYQQKWKCFISFLSRNSITFSEVTMASVLQFFTYLFYEKHLKPGTVAHYRSALMVPLKMHFQIDLNSRAIADLVRSMFIQRPNKPVTAPSWSLNKVLEFLDNQQSLNDSHAS